MRARLVWILVVVGLVTVGWSSGASGASFVWVWRVAGDLDPGASVELACPSAGLCVAVDGGGQVMRSTAPAVGVGSWSTTQVAGAPSFTALACAADSVCVGGDSAGRIWTFDDPAAGVGSPAAVELEPGTRIAGVACPSASAVRGGGGRGCARIQQSGGRGRLVAGLQERRRLRGLRVRQVPGGRLLGAADRRFLRFETRIASRSTAKVEPLA